jgi:hypothetical protein
MLMAKCCHDLDLLMWMNSGVAPTHVGSFGALTHFHRDSAPAGAGKRCLIDCKIEKACTYSARKMYVDNSLWQRYAWEHIEHLGEATRKQKLESLRNGNPYGRCVWHCDNDVVDHQVVAIEFADGSTATHNLVGGTAKPCRQIHITGTEGEIEGELETGVFHVRHPDLRKEARRREKPVDVKVGKDMHGGGDLRLVGDFVNVLRGEKPSISTTHLADSIYGALVGFAADKARVTRRTVAIKA